MERLRGRIASALACYDSQDSPGVALLANLHGREVFRHAVTRMAEAVEISLRANGLSTNDLDWVVPHQANIRIMDSMAKKLGLKHEQIIVTVDSQANTSAATIPLALAIADGEGRLKQGQLISLTAMGGGFTWGSVLLRW